MPNPIVRSKLFVPGSRPELFPKALGSAADAVSFDLEDAVLPAHKARAREQVAAALAGAALLPVRPLLIVRINAPGSAWFDEDMRVIGAAGADWINLPKAAGAADVQLAAAALQAAAAERESAGAPSARLLVNIETAAALHQAAAIACAHPRVVGLQLGLADLLEPLSIDRRDRHNVHAVMFALRMAAGAAGVLALDGAYPDIADGAGFRREAAMARGLGYAGKSCVHPSQVALANEVFGPVAADVAEARRLVAAALVAEAAGRGAFLFDGRMVDAPYVQRARVLLAWADRTAGLA